MWCTDPTLMTLKEFKRKHDVIAKEISKVDPEDLTPNIIGAMDIVENMILDAEEYHVDRSDMFRTYRALRKAYEEYRKKRGGK